MSNHKWHGETQVRDKRANLNKMVGEDLTEKATFSQSLEEGKGMNRTDVPGRRKRKCAGFELVKVTCFRKHKEDNMAETGVSERNWKCRLGGEVQTELIRFNCYLKCVISFLVMSKGGNSTH